jgi:hypothetical protein
VFFLWLSWIWVLVAIIGDVFSRRDASGWIKALWTFALIFLPFVGVLAYLIVNGGDMAERGTKQALARQARYDEYAGSAAPNGGGGAAREIEKAKGLLDGGTITPAEFDTLKAKALAA